MAHEVICGDNDAGRRLDRFLSGYLPHLPPALISRLIRQKHFKLNGARVTDPAVRIAAGDRLTCYLTDTQLAKTPDAARDRERWRSAGALPPIVYEDAQILVIDKPPGMLTHADAHGADNTLADRILADVYRRGLWDPLRENGYTPAPCHRLDRNTGGLVVAAKTAAAQREMHLILREKELIKRYLCLVNRVPEPRNGTLCSALVRTDSRVTVPADAAEETGAKAAVTQYCTLGHIGQYTLLACMPQTGRTHQIRAQLAEIGCPIAGDSKYGGDSRACSLALYAYELDFSGVADGCLAYLRGVPIRLTQVTLAGHTIQAPVL